MAQNSYVLGALADPDSELARLRRQAEVPSLLEQGLLQRAGLQPGSRVVDVGSGPGLTSRLMASSFSGCSVVGVELDGDLAALATQLNAELPCRFVRGSALSIPLRDDCADFAYARFLLQHLPDIATVAAEMRRVVTPGGRVVLLDVDDGTLVFDPAPRHFEHFHERVVRAQRELGGDRFVGRKLYRLLRQVGCSDVGVEVFPFSSQDFGMRFFIEIVIGFKHETLRSAGLLDERCEETLADFAALCDRPDAFGSVCCFVARGEA